MIEPTKDDIGRKVFYSDFKGDLEHGVISSFNDDYIFVKYEGRYNTQATSREDLSWSVET